MAKAIVKKIGREGRKRRAAGWTLLLLGLLVAGMWVASGWWKFDYQGDSLCFTLQRGFLTIWPTDPPPMDWTIEPIAVGARGWSFWIEPPNLPDTYSLGLYSLYDDAGGRRWHWFILWPIPLLLWPLAAMLLRSGILARRRANTGMCGKCGYSLAGLAAGTPCPECGKRAVAT